MKITITYLRQIIKEELSEVISHKELQDKVFPPEVRKAQEDFAAIMDELEAIATKAEAWNKTYQGKGLESSDLLRRFRDIIDAFGLDSDDYFPYDDQYGVYDEDE